MPFTHISVPIEYLGIEFVYFLFIAGICLAIYNKTKDVYLLTKHPGIYHFRNIFLYFLLAFTFRLLYLWMKLSRELFDISISSRIQFITLPFISYFSTLAILSLALAVVSKYFKGTTQISYLLHLVAVLLSIMVFFTRSPWIIILAQVLVVIITVIVLLRVDSRTSFLTQNTVTYFLLFIIWATNIMISSRKILPESKVILYLVSIAVFISVYRRLQKRLRDGKKARPL